MLLEQLQSLKTEQNVDKEDMLAQINQLIKQADYVVEDYAPEKPWGAFWRFENSLAPEFIKQFFPGFSYAEITENQDVQLSPKFLLVAPNQRLSWQYHFKRSEVWRSIVGPTQLVRSSTDEEGDVEEFINGSVIELAVQERHRLLAGDGWGLVAEIWRHVDNLQASDENDIVRISDDYERK